MLPSFTILTIKKTFLTVWCWFKLSISKEASEKNLLIVTHSRPILQNYLQQLQLMLQKCRA